MAINRTNFLLSLASALAAASTGAVTFPGNLFVHRADNQSSGRAAAAYAVLRTYGGPRPEELWPIDAMSVQAMASCAREADALALTEAIFEALYDTVTGSKRPRNRWVIPAKAIIAGAIAADTTLPDGWEVRLIVPMQPPGIIATDPQSGISDAVFNFDVRFSAMD